MGKRQPPIDSSELERSFTSVRPGREYRTFLDAASFRSHLFGAIQGRATYRTPFFEDLNQSRVSQDNAARLASLRLDALLRERWQALQDVEERHAAERGLVDVYTRVEMFMLRVLSRYQSQFAMHTTLNQKVKPLGQLLATFHQPAQEHGERTATYVKDIAPFLSQQDNAPTLTKARAKELVILARIQDIGYVALSDNAVKGAAPLVGVEQWQMEEHAAAGFEILRRLDFPAWCARTLLHQHRNFDGTGHPVGAGLPAQKPIEADVLLAADTLDILSNGNQTQAPLLTADIMTYFDEQRGKQFSPEVVNAVIMYLRSKLT